MSSVTLEWTEPESDGGAPVTQYTIDMKSGKSAQFQPCAKVDGDVLSYTCTKLKSNTKYDFQIRAENEIGPSAKVKSLDEPVKTKAEASK